MGMEKIQLKKEEKMPFSGRFSPSVGCRAPVYLLIFI